MKNIKTAQGAGQRGPSISIFRIFEWNRMSLDTKF